MRLLAGVSHSSGIVQNYYARGVIGGKQINTNTKWTSFETVKDPEFTVEFAKCGAIAFVSVIRDNNGSKNVDKQIEYPDKYKPFRKISVSNYSSDKEAFIELDTKLRIYAVQGHWVQINTVYPVQI